MHNLFFVLLENDADDITEDIKRAIGKDVSLEYREKANQVLDEQGFANQNGFYSAGKGDWFVIGGRWSGVLTRALGQKCKVDKKHFDKELKDLKKRHKDGILNKKQFEKQLKEHNEWAEKYGARDSYAQLGYEDDAMTLTEELLKGLKKTHKDVEVFDDEECDETTIEHLTEKDIGKIIVVVDYHN